MTRGARDDRTLLELMRLASPSLPVGGFSYSDVLEAAVESGRVSNLDEATAWLVDQLHLALARSDLAVVAHATIAWRNEDGDSTIDALHAWVSCTRESAELRAQGEQMGRSMAQWLRGGEPDARIDALDALRPAPTWPVAFALAGARTAASVREVVVAFAAGWAENAVQAAMRAVPLGQSAGQRLLSRLHDEIGRAVDTALATPTDALQAFTPMLAILSARHETQYSRLFRS